MPDGALGGPNEHVKAGGWRNQLSDGVFRAAGMPIHATWNDTLPMHDGHIGSECTHFCAPGAYNVWIWSLWRLLLSLDGQGEERLAATGVAEGSAAAAQAAATGQQQAAAGGGTAASAGAGAATTAGADGSAAAAAPRPPLPPPLPPLPVEEQAVDLHRKANRLLTRRIRWRSAASAYSKCHPDSVELEQVSDATMERLLTASKAEGQVVWANVTSVPCRCAAWLCAACLPSCACPGAAPAVRAARRPACR